MPSARVLALLLVLTVLTTLTLATHATLAEPSAMYLLKINHTIHMNYGYTYPVTYEFATNETANAEFIKVYYRFDLHQCWTLLPKKSWKDFYNGIYCYRVETDSGKTKIYVSVGFNDSNSDNIYLLFMCADNPLPVKYLGMTRYYDNRTCAVTATADDWCSNWSVLASYNVPLAFQECCNCFIHYHLYLTAGVITQENPPWDQIQKFVDTGYICIASHSRTHPHTPYANYTSEIGGSYHDIITHLHLSWWYRLGNRQYVYAWLEPYGECDAQVRHYLGVYHYLADRLYPSLNFNTFATWDPVNHLFNRAGFTIAMQNLNTYYSSTNSDTLNATFDKVYEAHGIYHLMIHPYLNTWTYGNYAWRHLAYISNRHDVWYVPFGILYLYHWATIGHFIKVIPLIYSSQEIVVPMMNPMQDCAVLHFSILPQYNTTVEKVLVDWNGDGIWDYAFNNCSFNVSIPQAGVFNVKVMMILSNGKTVTNEFIIHNYFLKPMLGINNTVDEFGRIIYTDGIGTPISVRIIPSRKIDVLPMFFSGENYSGQYPIFAAKIRVTKPTIVNIILKRNSGVWLDINNRPKFYPVNSTGYVNVIFKTDKNVTVYLYSYKPVTPAEEGVAIAILIILSSLVFVFGLVDYLNSASIRGVRKRAKYFKKIK